MLSINAQIQATNPLLVSYQNSLIAAGVNPNSAAAFITEVVPLLSTGYNSANPALLVEQINDLANKGWTVILPKKIAVSDGETDVPGKDIQMVAPANLTNTQSIATAANQFVKTLAYEIGHAENSQVNTLEYVGTEDGAKAAYNALAVGAQVAEDLLSEAGALYNQIKAQKQGIPITTLSDPDAQGDEIHFYNSPQQALLLGAEGSAQGQSTISNQSALAYYWNGDLGDSGLNASNTNPTLLEVMESMVMSTPGNFVSFSQNSATDAITMTINFAYNGSGNNTVQINGSGQTVSSYSDTFNGYGTISPSGIIGGNSAPKLINGATGSATAEQIFNFVSGGSLEDVYNPSTSITEEISTWSGANGTGNLLSDIQNFTDGTSDVLQTPTSLPAGVLELYLTYSGLNGTGDVIGADLKLTASSQALFDANTASAVTYSSTLGAELITLVAQDPIALGTLSINTETAADSFTFADGMVIDLPGITGDETVTDPGNSIAPLTVLSDYLSDLDDPLTTAQLTADNYAYLNPTGTAYTVTGSVVNVNNTSANVTYAVGGAPGAVATGQSTAVISVNGKNVTVPATNFLNANGNISNDTITNVPTLELYNAGITLTSAQFNGFATLKTTSTGNSTITISTAGTDSLAKVTGTGPIGTFAASGWGGTTLIGNSQAEQALKASLFGNDTLEAGSGAGDYLFAGEGVDTLIVESWLAAALLNSMQTASAF
jgi:hypothetical protein